MRRRHEAELTRLDRQHANEIARKERVRARERTREGKASPEQVHAWEAQHQADITSDKKFQAEDRKGLQLNHEGERNNLRDERRGEAARIKGQDARERRKTLERHRGERADLIEQHGFRRKGAGDGRDRPLAERGHAPARGDWGAVERGDVGYLRQLSSGRTHKASSAEDILRHVLRLLGWTAAYRRGELTERRRIKLLDAVRQYGREWLRHEAEQLFRVHGTERSLASAAKHAVGRFFDRARGFVRELIVAGSMAINGPEPLDDHDLAEADRAAVVQSMYLERFAAEVELNTPPELAVPTAPPAPNALSAPQIIDRAEKYAGSVWGDAINARRQKVIRSGRYSQERRVHARPMGQHDACTTCLGESDKGWVPIGRLLPIGDSECLGIRCDCYFEFRNAA